MTAYIPEQTRVNLCVSIRPQSVAHHKIRHRMQRDRCALLSYACPLRARFVCCRRICFISVIERFINLLIQIMHRTPTESDERAFRCVCTRFICSTLKPK